MRWIKVKYLAISFFILHSLMGSTQSKTDKFDLKKEIIGTWLEEKCSGGEVYASSFHFYNNGKYRYSLGSTDPNPILSINGNFEIIRDTGSGFILKLKVTSSTVVATYSIDADGNAPSPGIFGFNFNKEQIKTIVQRDSIFHAFKIKICNSANAEVGSDLTCPCIQIDKVYLYYKVSNNTEY